MSDLPEPFSPDDPRLSAYVLGEMDADERAAFEENVGGWAYEPKATCCRRFADLRSKAEIQ